MPARIDEDASFRMFDQVDRDRQSEPVFFFPNKPEARIMLQLSPPNGSAGGTQTFPVCQT